MIKQYELTPDDFRSGKYDDYFRTINLYQDSVNEYTPIRPHTLNRQHYNEITTTVAQFPYIVSKWQSTIGQNNSSVFVFASENISDRTKALKKRVETKIYDFFYKKLKWNTIEKEIIALLISEGNAVVMLNELGNVIVHSIFRFNVYQESNQKIVRYAFVDKNGTETALNNLKHGVDIFHIKDPIFAHFTVAPSRIDAAYSFIMLEQKGVKSNTNLFANGFLSNVFLKFDYDKMPAKAKDQTLDKDGKTWFDRLMDRVNDKFRGVAKSARVGHLFGLDSILEAGKNNKDTQFYELIKELTPERLAWAYSMNLADFGAGSNTTYNNASTFDDALYDKVGRPLERLLDEVRNDFLAPLFGLYASTNTFISYNEPADPHKLEEVKEWREDFKAGLITIDEYRDKRGLEMIDNTLLQQEPSIIEVKPKEITEASFAQKKKTIVEQTIDSKEFTKFNNKLKKAFVKQIESYADYLENKDEVDKTIKLDNFESFFSFTAFRDNLKKFAKIGYDDVVKDDRINFAKNDDIFGIYSDEVMAMINKRVDALLNGTAEFNSIDVETAAQIQTIVSKNIELGTKQIAVKIREKIESISLNRAELIAQMEVVNAVESTRNTIYIDNDYSFKRALNNAPVTDECQANKQKGAVPIDYVYEHTLGSGLYPPFHFRCKTSLIYGESADELE